jgi:hypothetical protein
MTELKPCPFCGSVPNIEQKLWGWMIYCTKCECVYKNCNINPPMREETIIKWNTRQESEEIPEWLKHDIKQHLYFIRHVKNPRTMTVEESMGYVEALEWVLSLKKPEE